MKVQLTHNTPKVIAAFLAMPRTMERAVDPKVRRAAIELSRDARRRAPKAFSTLTQSIIYRRRRAMDYEVTAGMNYSRAVEEGTGPGGTPSWQTMVDWIRVKRIKPRDPSLTEADLTFLIIQAIHKRGTKAQPYMEPAFKALRPRIELLMAEGVRDGLRQVARA